MALSDLVLAITGASGSPYAIRLLQVLLQAGRTVHLVISPAAGEVFEREIGRTLERDPAKFRLESLLGDGVSEEQRSRVQYHSYRDFQCGIASGSFLTGGMVICPCSMGTLASIAHGISENLIHRAADVHLKERRKLVLVPRETPLGLSGLRNMVTVTEAGAVVMPAMPGFYQRPQTIEDMVDFVVMRICDQLGVSTDLMKRWGQQEPEHEGVTD